MNKIIQRQDIMPPWIEKQQELVKAAHVFRARLRNDWTRTAARTIASRGGSLQEQMLAADRYAESERVHNPKGRAVEQIAVSTNVTHDPVFVTISQAAPANSSDSTPAVEISLKTKDGETTISTEKTQTVDPISNHLAATESTQKSLPAPFRIPTWEAAELSYLTLAITNLNNLARSYNLMAPDLAKKPYFNLERELRSCYADVAPQLSAVIRERAARPARALVEKIGHRPGSVLEKFGGETAKVYDSKKPLYGFKEFWSDLWGEKRV